MIDLHSHILPELDDGAKDIEETIAMAKIAASQGFTKIIATPHHRKPEYIIKKEDILEKIKLVNEHLQKENIDLEIYPGLEVYIERDIPLKLKNKELLSLNNSSYILIELPMKQSVDYIEDVLHEVKVQGYKPIIAHPERYLKVIEDPNYVKSLIKKGCYMQVNALSFTGYFGEECKRTVETLLKHKMIHLISTDAHSSTRRVPKIKNAIEQMKRLCDETYVDEIINNGFKVFHNENIIMPNPITYVNKKSFMDKVMELVNYTRKSAITKS